MKLREFERATKQQLTARPASGVSTKAGAPGAHWAPAGAMNILVVDGFSRGSEGRRRFQCFREMVDQAFAKCWAHGTRVEVRKYNDVGEFVPASSDGIIRVTPIQNFDKLDFVFIDGDLPLRPWTPSAQAVSGSGRLPPACKQHPLYVLHDTYVHGYDVHLVQSAQQARTSGGSMPTES
jgi:hypothetical protein